MYAIMLYNGIPPYKTRGAAVGKVGSGCGRTAANRASNRHSTRTEDDIYSPMAMTIGRTVPVRTPHDLVCIDAVRALTRADAMKPIP